MPTACGEERNGQERPALEGTELLKAPSGDRIGFFQSFPLVLSLSWLASFMENKKTQSLHLPGHLRMLSSPEAGLSLLSYSEFRLRSCFSRHSRTDRQTDRPGLASCVAGRSCGFSQELVCPGSPSSILGPLAGLSWDRLLQACFCTCKVGFIGSAS